MIRLQKLSARQLVENKPCSPFPVADSRWRALAQLHLVNHMTSKRVLIIVFALLIPSLIVADPPTTQRKVRVTHYGYPNDPNMSQNTKLGVGDHDNILGPGSIAVSPDLNNIFPFRSAVSVEGHFLGFRHDTTNRKWRNTIAVYDPNGDFKRDFESYIDVPAKKK